MKRGYKVWAAIAIAVSCTSLYLNRGIFFPISIPNDGILFYKGSVSFAWGGMSTVVCRNGTVGLSVRDKKYVTVGSLTDSDLKKVNAILGRQAIYYSKETDMSGLTDSQGAQVFIYTGNQTLSYEDILNSRNGYVKRSDLFKSISDAEYLSIKTKLTEVINKMDDRDQLKQLADQIIFHIRNSREIVVPWSYDVIHLSQTDVDGDITLDPEQLADMQYFFSQYPKQTWVYVSDANGVYSIKLNPDTSLHASPIKEWDTTLLGFTPDQLDSENKYYSYQPGAEILNQIKEETLILTQYYKDSNTQVDTVYSIGSLLQNSTAKDLKELCE